MKGVKRIGQVALQDIHRILLGLALHKLAGSYLIPTRLRYLVYRALGLDVQRSTISPHCIFGSRSISIGRGTFINRDCFFAGTAPIKIGKNCSIGVSVKVINSDHLIGDTAQRAGAIVSKPVIIQDGVWIGSSVVILPGVTIGSGCIIGAAALVTSDCEPDGLYVGVPAKRKRELTK
jgi:maltose O-acetyltransferase